MSEPQVAPQSTRPEEWSGLFGQLVLQQSNLAMMLMGQVPHPQTGKVTRDLEAARMFIDQLEMLEAKTKGNLTREESGLLKQSLMALRLAFVQAVEEPGVENPAQPPAAPTNPEQATGTATGPAPEPSAAEAEHRDRVKFTKKY